MFQTGSSWNSVLSPSVLTVTTAVVAVVRSGDFSAMGVSLLKEPFRLAAHILMQTSFTVETASGWDALCFIEGSGLDAVLTTFGMEVDPTELRRTFYRWCRRKRHPPSAS